MKKLTALLLFAACLFIPFTGIAQDDVPLASQLSSLPAKYYQRINQKLTGLGGKLDRQTDQYLRKIEKQETKIYKKLWRKDSSAAKELMGNVQERYTSLRTNAAIQAKQLSNLSRMYSSKLDSLGTAFRFLENNSLIPPALKKEMTGGLEAINGLQGKMDQADQVRRFLKERKQLLAAQLEKVGLVKDLKKYNKQVYYYQQQIKEYKELLNDPDRLAKKLLGLLAKLPAFKDFFANNSRLASLFNLPGSINNNATSLAGLQTRASVVQDMQNRFGTGAAVQQAIQQNMQSAQDQLNQLKGKITQRLPQGGGSDEEMPEFKPNNQKTKIFWQRLEYGTNFQSRRPRGYFPVTSDIGLSLGYKLNDKSVVGVGASYKVGWGQNIRNIRVSHQGAGVRSFADVKLKGSLWISGGYEMNYQSGFNRVQELRDLNAWQQSGLIGISKVVSMNSKFFKKTKVQLLWDFLSYQQVPRTQALVFRVGYGLK
jgi:hypothetical protein